VSKVKGSLRLAGFLGLTVPLMPVQALFNATSPKLARRFPTLYHKILCRILGVRVHIEGEVPKSAALVVANHVSWLDIPVMSSVLNCSFVARHDMASWPLFGKMAKLQQTVLVDRKRRTDTGDVKAEMQARIARGDTLVLFPEGTSHDGINVLPFKSSFFAAAGDAQVVPVTLAYRGIRGLPMTRRERPYFAWYGNMDMAPHLWTAAQQGRLDVTLKFHPPLTENDRKSLARKAEAQVRGSLAALLQG
jgi:lyso-ornithine lipid O-acyltransferase